MYTPIVSVSSSRVKKGTTPPSGKYHQVSKQIFPNPSYSIKDINLKMQFQSKNPTQYDSSKVYEMTDFDKVIENKQKTDDKIQQLRNGYNCELIETNDIEKEDSASLMNLIVGGYTDKQFDEYLSVNEFNDKKDDFDTLGEIYEVKAKQFKVHCNNSPETLPKRSLLAMIYLNQNVKKVSRFKIEEHMKRNKMVW